MPKPTRPVLRYHGGKWRIAPWIIAHFPPDEVYCEPFAGAASVFLQEPQTRIEVLNDLDTHIVSLFQILRDPRKAARLRRAIELTPFSRKEHRRAWTAGGDPIEEARKLIVRSFQSIGAKDVLSRNGWRTRTAKAIWSPCVSWNGWPNAIPAITARLKQAIIECKPYHQLLDIYDDKTTLFYVDPPYLLHTRSRNTATYAHELTQEQHVELCHRLQAVKGHVLLSAYKNPLYDELLPTWHVETTKARAQCNSPRIEALYIKPWASRSLFSLNDEDPRL